MLELLSHELRKSWQHMSNVKSFISIIPARGGSKRLPNKNILDFAGKPLVSWTIDAALQSKYINRTIVSSDSEAVLSVANEFGAEALKRPDELSGDFAQSFDAVEHAIKNTGFYDYVVMLQPTSPLRTAEHIDQAIELLNRKNADAIISVCLVDHPPFWSNTLPEDLSMKSFLDDKVKNKRSQDFEAYYRLNGAIYICRYEKLLKERTFFLNENIYAFIMPQEASIDIDTPMDFKIAEVFMDNK